MNSKKETEACNQIWQCLIEFETIELLMKLWFQFIDKPWLYFSIIFFLPESAMSSNGSKLWTIETVVATIMLMMNNDERKSSWANDKDDDDNDADEKKK